MLDVPMLLRVHSLRTFLLAARVVFDRCRMVEYIYPRRYNIVGGYLDPDRRSQRENAMLPVVDLWGVNNQELNTTSPEVQRSTTEQQSPMLCLKYAHTFRRMLQNECCKKKL
jgi:hypothetical protein